MTEGLMSILYIPQQWFPDIRDCSSKVILLVMRSEASFPNRESGGKMCWSSTSHVHWTWSVASEVYSTFQIWKSMWFLKFLNMFILPPAAGFSWQLCWPATASGTVPQQFNRCCCICYQANTDRHLWSTQMYLQDLWMLCLMIAVLCLLIYNMWI